MIPGVVAEVARAFAARAGVLAGVAGVIVAGVAGVVAGVIAGVDVSINSMFLLASEEQA